MKRFEILVKPKRETDEGSEGEGRERRKSSLQRSPEEEARGVPFSRKEYERYDEILMAS